MITLKTFKKFDSESIMENIFIVAEGNIDFKGDVLTHNHLMQMKPGDMFCIFAPDGVRQFELIEIVK